MIAISRIPLINRVIRKRGQRRLRKYMKAYREVKNAGLLYKVNEAKQAISRTQCIRGGRYAKYFFGTAVNSAEIVIRQYLLRGLIDHTINKPLVYAAGKRNRSVVYPLPHEWRNILRQSGFDVPVTRSALFFCFFVLAKFFAGILSLVQYFYHSLKWLLINRKQPLGRYAFFASLGPKNIPHAGTHGRSYDTISWYAQWDERQKPLDSLVHTAGQQRDITVNGMAVVSAPDEIQPLADFGKLGRYFLWCCGAVLCALADLLRGRWWHALILGEAGKSAAIRIQSPEELARDYLFHNAVAIYRPLWTYDAEHAGSRILFYFYSTNIEFFKRRNRYPEPFVGWETGTWPNHLVWDDYQAAFMQDIVSQKINIFITGPIWFQSGDEELPELKQKAIAVFDVQPMRDSFHSSLAVDFDYYTPATCSGFLFDIYEAVKKMEAVVVHKRKRDIGKLVHYAYRNLLNKLGAKQDFISVHPDLAAQLIIEKSVAVISMPFTSTALAGRVLGKPSVYYDPHGLISKDDKGAHGIEILTGPSELERWLKMVLRQG